MGIFEVSLHTLPVRFKTLTVDPVTGLEEGVVRKAVNDVARTYTIPIGNVAPDTFVALTKDQKSVIAAYGRRGNGERDSVKACGSPYYSVSDIPSSVFRVLSSVAEHWQNPGH